MIKTETISSFGELCIASSEGKELSRAIYYVGSDILRRGHNLRIMCIKYLKNLSANQYKYIRITSINVAEKLAWN